MIGISTRAEGREPLLLGEGVRPALMTAVVLLAVALATRAVQFGNPLIHVDEQFYLLVGQRMLDGALPYVDVWDRKPVGLFLLYALFAGIGDGVLAYQLGATLFAAATAFLIVLCAQRLAGRGAATWAGVLYLCSLLLLGGEGGQSPVFYNAFMAGAGLAILAAADAPRSAALLRRGALAMLLVGVAIQIKYVAVFEGMVLGCALLVLHVRRFGVDHRLAAHGLVWVAAALTPTVLALAVYAGLGHAAEFVQANFVSIFQKVVPRPEKLPLRLAKLVGLSLPICLAAIAGLRLALRDPERRRAALLVTAWFAAAVLAVLGFGTWYDHYALPILVPAAIAAAPLFGAAGRRRWLGLAAIGFGAAVGLALIIGVNRPDRGDAEDLAPFVAAIGNRPQGCLYIFDGNTVPLVLTRACLLTRYAFPGHLSGLSEEHAIGTSRADELRRVFARGPAFVMMRQEPSRNVDRRARAMVLGEIARNYRLVRRGPVGKEVYLLFRRKGVPPPAD